MPEDTSDGLYAAMKSLGTTLQGAVAPLQMFAVIQAFREIYPDKERQELVVEYRNLLATYEERLEAYKEAELVSLMSPGEAEQMGVNYNVVERRTETLKAVGEIESEIAALRVRHPLLYRVFEFLERAVAVE